MSTRPRPARTNLQRRGCPTARRSARSKSLLQAAEAPDRATGREQQICELEWMLTDLRQRFRSLQVDLAKLSASREHFLDLFENAPTGYVVHDRLGAIRKLNRAAAALLRLGHGGYAQATFAQFVTNEDLDRWLHHIRDCTKHLRSTTQLTLRPPNGERVPVELVTIALASPPGRPPTQFRTTITDITQRLAAAAARADTRQDYRQLIDTVEGIVWEADAQTLDISFVSRHAERVCGFPSAEWTRPGFWQNRIYVEDRERVANLLAGAAARQERTVLEYRVVTADRRLVWLQDNVTTFKRAGALRLLGVAIDVTERHQAEEKLRQARDLLEQRVAERTEELRQRVEDLEAFSYSLSHDMRSPLRAMQGYATLLERTASASLGAQGLDFLHRIIHSAERLDLLVQDVLTYTRVASVPVQLKTISLDDLLETILRDYPALASRRGQILLQRPLLPVHGHEASMTQALSNLLTNALKFVPQGRVPCVRVWTERTRGGEAQLPWVRLWVEDNGLGIAPEDQKRIFRMFERIHPSGLYEGTGIGLAIVQKAVERMGGRVGLESAPDQGSKFWIELRPAQV